MHNYCGILTVVKSSWLKRTFWAATSFFSQGGRLLWWCLENSSREELTTESRDGISAHTYTHTDQVLNQTYFNISVFFPDSLLKQSCRALKHTHNIASWHTSYRFFWEVDYDFAPSPQLSGYVDYDDVSSSCSTVFSSSPSAGGGGGGGGRGGRGNFSLSHIKSHHTSTVAIGRPSCEQGWRGKNECIQEWLYTQIDNIKQKSCTVCYGKFDTKPYSIPITCIRT